MKFGIGVSTPKVLWATLGLVPCRLAVTSVLHKKQFIVQK